MNVKLLSGALGAEISGIDLTDTSDQNFKKINDLLLEHKVIFFRDQPITNEQQIALAAKFGPLETHAYVKGLKDHPEIVRIIKGKEEKNQWVHFLFLLKNLPLLLLNIQSRIKIFYIHLI